VIFFQFFFELESTFSKARYFFTEGKKIGIYRNFFIFLLYIVLKELYLLVLF